MYSGESVFSGAIFSFFQLSTFDFQPFSPLRPLRLLCSHGASHFFKTGFGDSRRIRAFCYSIVFHEEIIFPERRGRTKLCGGLVPKTQTVFHPLIVSSTNATHQLTP
jgi:hypothetical protein